jgi:PAS domain S-box-containing protein
MNYYAFIPLAAFIINFFTLTYVVALRRKSPVNRAYLLVALSFAILSMASFASWSLEAITWRLALMKGVSITWIAFGFTFLNFTYAFLEKKRDLIYYASLISVMLFYIISLTTNFIISGFEHYYWGYYEKTGRLFPLSALINFFLPSIYSIGLITHKRFNTEDRQTQKQLESILIGTSSLIIVALLSDIISIHIFNIYFFLNLSTVGTAIQSLFIFRAVNKYNFLSIGVEEVSHDLFTNIRDGIILVDNNASIIQLNESAKEMFDIRDLSIPVQISSLFADYDFDRDYRNYETRLGNRDLDTVVSLSQATVRQYGVELGKLMIIRDITENKKVEENLRQSKAQLEALAGALEQKVVERTASLHTSNLELRRQIAERERAEAARAEEQERLSVTLSSIGDGVITIDTTGHVTLLNKVAEALTGWLQHQAMGQPLRVIFRLLDDQKRLAPTTAVEEALQSNKIVNRTRLTILISQNGTEYLIAESGAPIRAQDGSVIGAVLVFRDMTERQKIEEELVKADRLESIGVLAGGIAHDFNNILTAIMGNISLASMYAKEDDKVSKRLDNAEKAAVRAQDLTQQLLSFSKGGAPLKRLASIKDLIQESVDFSLRGSNVRCELALDHALWPADIDSGQISQVIHNLIINANQAMPNGGILGVRAENVVVDESCAEFLVALKPGRYVKIIIADEGCGIPEEQLQRIFDPYFTTKDEGSGLGLFTAYSIIKKHDGHIDVASAVAIGTTFSVYLPASDRVFDASVSVVSRLTSGSGKVLVMENEEELCEVVEGILLHFGYEVVFAKDGTEAIVAYQYAKDTCAPFDAIIMDLTIPGGMGGKEAIEQLLALDPDVKAIVASGYANDPIMANYRAYGFVSRIAKPYRTDTLHQILREVIG